MQQLSHVFVVPLARSRSAQFGNRWSRQKMTRISGGKDGLPDEWDKTAKMLRKTAETVLGVTFGKQKRDRET